MSPAWHLFQSRNMRTTLPPLLVWAEFASNAYTVNITDLTHLWSESLDRRGIIKRSLDEDTSIDPSEDAQQMSMFLDKIQSALKGSKNTSLSIETRPGGTPEAPPPIDVSITVELPKGLSSLKWPMHLKLLPQATFTSQVTLPLLQAHSTRIEEVDGLVDILRDKDHVIQKLIDKVESTGAELGHVFPGAAGKGGRMLPRKVAEERVKGLRVFDAREWRKEMKERQEDDHMEDISTTVARTFEADDGLNLTQVDQGSPKIWGLWWTQVGNDPIELSTKKVKSNTESKIKAPIIQGHQKPTAQDDDDDFQIQSSPSRRPQSPAARAASPPSPRTLQSQGISTESTNDEGDLNGPSQPSAIPDSFPRSPPRHNGKKLGVIGRPNPVPERSVEPTVQAKTQASSSRPVAAKPLDAEDVNDDDETASEDEYHQDQLPDTTTVPNQTSAPAPTQPKRTSPIGLIGKKAQASAPSAPLHSDPSRPSPPSPQNTPLPPKPKAKAKLGLIGRKFKAPAAQEQEEAVIADEKNEVSKRDGERSREKSDEHVRGRDHQSRGSEDAKWKVKEMEMERESERERETSRKRADRKREELKRELEVKAKVPVKKKRRF